MYVKGECVCERKNVCAKGECVRVCVFVKGECVRVHVCVYVRVQE